MNILLIEGKEDALVKIRDSSIIEKLSDPYGYVKAIQAGFDYSSIPFSDGYYDVTGMGK